MASSRAIMRQSRNLFRQQQRRQASSATEKASEVASSAKESAQNATSKASEGLTKVTSSAGSSVSNAASSAQATLGRIGGRTGRAIQFVQCTKKPVSCCVLFNTDNRSINTAYNLLWQSWLRIGQNDCSTPENDVSVRACSHETSLC